MVLLTDSWKQNTVISIDDGDGVLTNSYHLEIVSTIWFLTPKGYPQLRIAALMYALKSPELGAAGSFSQQELCYKS